ncbi:26S proteasome regulatory subunit 6A-like isoform X4 [Panicum virgatum]|nr:26S proteasome regulatory subunit 6A-like isoform X4 [Panicum virgatum]
MNSEDEAEENGANIDLDSQRKGKCAVLKTSMRQILEMNSEDEAEENGANIDLDSQRKGKCAVLKTSMRQILEMNSEDEAEEDGANIDLDSQRKGKCVVLKTSMRQVLITTTAVFVLICAADKVPEESLMKTIEVDRLIDMVSDANPRELIDEKIHWMHVDMTKGGPLHVSEQ